MCCSRVISKADRSRPAACMTESIVYQLSCDGCASMGIKAHYRGESSRTGYLHGKEHNHGQLQHAQDNALHKHNVIHHEGRAQSYSMKMLRAHRKTLTHQIHEATIIQHSQADIQLNSKGEYNGPRIPRVVLEVGVRVITLAYRGQDNTHNTQGEGAAAVGTMTPDQDRNQDVHLGQEQDLGPTVEELEEERMRAWDRLMRKATLTRVQGPREAGSYKRAARDPGR